MSNNADRPEVTAATRKKSRARKKPVMSAMRARQDPTCALASFHLFKGVAILRYREGESVQSGHKGTPT
jgi:hypothetical protein